MAFLLIEYHLGRSLHSLLVAEYLFIRFIANRIVALIKFQKKRKGIYFLKLLFLVNSLQFLYRIALLGLNQSINQSYCISMLKFV